MRLYLRYSGPGTSIDFGEELPVLGSFGNPRGSNEGNTGFGHLNGRPSPKAAAEDAKKRELRPDQLIDHEWSELPYTMMRVTLPLPDAVVAATGWLGIAGLMASLLASE